MDGQPLFSLLDGSRDLDAFIFDGDGDENDDDDHPSDASGDRNNTGDAMFFYEAVQSTTTSAIVIDYNAPSSSSRMGRSASSRFVAYTEDTDDVAGSAYFPEDFEAYEALRAEKTRKADVENVPIPVAHSERLMRRTALSKAFQDKVAGNTVRPGDVNELVACGLRVDALQRLIDEATVDGTRVGRTELEGATQEATLRRLREFVHGLLTVVKIQSWWRMKALARRYVSTSSTLGPLKRFFFREWRRIHRVKKIAQNSHMRGPFQAWAEAAEEQRELKNAVDALIRRKIEQPRLSALSVAAYLKVGQEARPPPPLPLAALSLPPYPPPPPRSGKCPTENATLPLNGPTR